ncbi:hypothetical protein [Celeribacter indicus]|uniref:Uncharacterized protein n=1 Tax=Celeribacter indicus TaxID=1208324 RepID=A0A0B5E014_9RHOB|nr:hypothetical protein [Celeribacter indicus]AJE49043.1 hypothetical protein P73_4328 [Celeribacter indicus]SDW44481.1 hypothetical protein SAMN05443573_103252 [Celeribacter indicus]
MANRDIHEKPENLKARAPEKGVLDQRQQQIDPAGRHRADLNATSIPSMKQPGGPHPAPATGTADETEARRRKD